MINIINYGLNNIFSIKNCLDNLNINSKIISKPEEFEQGNKLILPGVGSFKVAMSRLSNDNWINFIKTFIKDKENYLLGICLGMQLLSSKSFEGEMTSGLNLIKTDVKKLSVMECDKKLPHVGWNNVIIKKKCDIFRNIPDNLDFYFVHSYALEHSNFDIAYFSYGKSYTAAVQHENIFGVQFHPEKSADGGKMILKNFNDL
jgi:glutamine amidotransferase